MHSINPCRNLPQRGTTYTLPLSPAAGADIDDEVSRIAFTFVSGEAPDPCLDVILYFLCLVGTPPCDPESGGWPLPICDSDCQAVKKLLSDDTCDSTIDFVKGLAHNTSNEELIHAIELFENFDCNNVSTYEFHQLNSFAESCTGLLSEKSKGLFLLLMRHKDIFLFYRGGSQQ